MIDGDLDAAAGLMIASPNDDDNRARIVDQAIGVLLDRGYPPAEALDEPQRRADASGQTLAAQAQLVLRALS